MREEKPMPLKFKPLNVFLKVCLNAVKGPGPALSRMEITQVQERLTPICNRIRQWPVSDFREDIKTVEDLERFAVNSLGSRLIFENVPELLKSGFLQLPQLRPGQYNVGIKDKNGVVSITQSNSRFQDGALEYLPEGATDMLIIRPIDLKTFQIL
jgi:hypothetical protein